MKSINDIFKFAQIYNPISVGIETTGQQQGFISILKTEMLNKNIYFNLASNIGSKEEGIRPNAQKFTRFLTIVPWFKQGLIYFPKELKDSTAMVEAIEELSLVSNSGFKSKHDDFCDTISMLSVMDIWLPSDNQINMEYNQQTNIWEEVSHEVETSSLDSYLC